MSSGYKDPRVYTTEELELRGKALKSFEKKRSSIFSTTNFMYALAIGYSVFLAGFAAHDFFDQEHPLPPAPPVTVTPLPPNSHLEP